eukprot:5993020-Amphidinium_carterae.1
MECALERTFSAGFSRAHTEVSTHTTIHNRKTHELPWRPDLDPASLGRCVIRIEFCVTCLS